MNSLRSWFGRMPHAIGLWVVFAGLFSAVNADAKPISGDQLARALEICLIADDGNPFHFGGDWGCCSKSKGFCVFCEGEPSYDKVCEIEANRTITDLPDKGEGIRKPPIIGDQIDEVMRYKLFGRDSIQQPK